jgi:stage III sporulation protein AB
MKYVLILFIFALCTYIGYLFSAKYAKRRKFFSALIGLAEKLSLEINFSRERLRVLIESFDSKQKKDLLGVDEAFLRFLDKKEELSAETMFKKTDVLKPDEKDLVFSFFRVLGRSDVENQTKEIDSFVSRFSSSLNECKEEQKKYGSLSIKLGIVAGLFCAVILF